MTAKLISYSELAVDPAARRDKDLLELIAFCARVSNPNNQNNPATAEKLVKYLPTYVLRSRCTPMRCIALSVVYPH